MRRQAKYRRKMTKLDEAYFDWLCITVRCETEWIETLKELYETPFSYCVANDDNRANDGLALRDLYLSGVPGLDMFHDLTYEPVNVLETLIALADRMDFILFDPDLEVSQTSKFFWELIENLKLIPDSPVNRIKISKFLERKYSPNGVGGIFPLHSTFKDQRKVEIWYQMMEYIVEVYDD